MTRAAWALTAIAALSLAPLVYMARVSLGSGGALPIAPSDWWTGGFTLDHYRSLASGEPFQRRRASAFAPVRADCAAASISRIVSSVR